MQPHDKPGLTEALECYLTRWADMVEGIERGVYRWYFLGDEDEIGVETIYPAAAYDIDSVVSKDVLQDQAPELLVAWKATDRVYLSTHGPFVDEQLTHGEGCKIHTSVDANRPKLLAVVKDRLDSMLKGTHVARTAAEHRDFDFAAWKAWEEGDDSHLVETGAEWARRSKSKILEASARLRWGSLPVPGTVPQTEGKANEAVRVRTAPSRLHRGGGRGGRLRMAGSA